MKKISSVIILAGWPLVPASVLAMVLPMAAHEIVKSYGAYLAISIIAAISLISTRTAYITRLLPQQMLQLVRPISMGIMILILTQFFRSDPVSGICSVIIMAISFGIICSFHMKVPMDL